MKPSGWFSFASNLFNNEQRTLLDKVLLVLGTLSGAVVGVVSAFDQFPHAVARQQTMDLLVDIAAYALLIFMITVALIGMRVLGIAAGKATWFSQFIFVFKRLCLILFLPALILTAILLLMLWMNGAFNRY